jgi:hypothetical protein
MRKNHRLALSFELYLIFANEIDSIFRAPLKTLLWLLTCFFFQLLRCRNTHLAQLNSVFSALYLKKITALSFQTELLEMPFSHLPLYDKRNIIVVVELFYYPIQLNLK